MDDQLTNLMPLIVRSKFNQHITELTSDYAKMKDKNSERADRLRGILSDLSEVLPFYDSMYQEVEEMRAKLGAMTLLIKREIASNKVLAKEIEKLKQLNGDG